MRRRQPVPFTLLLALLAAAAGATGPVGYYRQPALHGEVVVFVAEGDLWRVDAAGGEATRLTSAPGPEEFPVISPDGATVAFRATYEGSPEIYTLPLAGGAPVRRTWHGDPTARPVGWTGDRRLLIATSLRATLPDLQLATLDVARPDAPFDLAPVQLAQAADGTFAPDGTLYFTRLPFNGSHTRRYRGGTVQTLWRFRPGDAEATPLTADYPGTSRSPMWWQGRVYFVSDRDGTQNLWSMDAGRRRPRPAHAPLRLGRAVAVARRRPRRLPAGRRSPPLRPRRRGEDRTLAVTLRSDLDQTREHWVAEPLDYLTAAHLAPDGERLALTARGEVFVAPRRQGRLVTTSRAPGVRLRDARFLPDGKGLVVLSDQSGEVELWRLPANGVGDSEQLTRDGDILRWEAVPSPDGRYLAHDDKKQRLFLYDTKTRANRQIDASEVDRFRDLAWSPDGRWLAYVAVGDNLLSVVRLYGVESGRVTTITSDRFDSSSPAWSADGKWLWFLSDRHLESVVPSPWGSYAPEPFLDRRTEIYQLALVARRALAVRARRRAPPGAKTDERSRRGGEGRADAEAGRTAGGRRRSCGEGAARHRCASTSRASRRGSSACRVPRRQLRLARRRQGRALLARARGRRGDRDPPGARSQERPGQGRDGGREAQGLRALRRRKRVLLRQDKQLLVVDAKPEKAKLEDVVVDLSRWRSRSSRARSGGRCSARPGGSSATTSTTAACTASTGRGCWRSTSRWSTG